jgi:hypothetical protein
MKYLLVTFENSYEPNIKQIFHFECKEDLKNKFKELFKGNHLEVYSKDGYEFTYSSELIEEIHHEMEEESHCKYFGHSKRWKAGENEIYCAFCGLTLKE